MSRRGIWLVSSLLALMGVGGLVLLWMRGRVERAEHVAHVDWLPAEASNICYYRSRSCTAAEFRISEENFVKWCKERGFALTPITDSPFKIYRYMLPEAQDKLRSMVNQDDLRSGAQQELYGMTSRTVVHGLRYKELSRNGGGVSVAYDRDVGVAFYLSTQQ